MDDNEIKKRLAGRAAEYMNFYIIEPPEDEQKRIAEYLDQKCSKVDELISIKQQKITLLLK